MDSVPIFFEDVLAGAIIGKDAGVGDGPLERGREGRWGERERSKG